MNIKTDDNHITALLDTRDGKRFRDHAFEQFGSCLEHHLQQTINEKVEKMLPGRNDMKLGTELTEAFAIVSSFLEVGRQNDLNTKSEVSDEALRATAMFTAAAFYMMFYDARVFKENFLSVWNKFNGTLSDTDRLMGYVIYLQDNHEGLKQRNAMCANVARGLMSVIGDVVIQVGLRDTSEDAAK